MKLKLVTTADNVLLVSDDGEAIAMCNHVAHAQVIARAVNRDHLFDSMAAALTIFGSAEMGAVLADMIETSGLAIGIPDERVAKESANIRKLINSVDVILKHIELAGQLESKTRLHETK